MIYQNKVSGYDVNVRVADPHSFHPDPDPAFLAEYRSGSMVLITKFFF
jgi:hypothetical protein